MENKVRVAVCKTFSSLFEEVLCQSFIKLLASPHIAEQVSTCTEFHHEAKMAVCVEGIVQLDYIPVARQELQDLHLLGDPPLAFNFLVQVFLRQ